MPLFVCARPEIYCGSGAPHLLGPSDLPYRTDYPSYATRTLSWERTKNLWLQRDYSTNWPATLVWSERGSFSQLYQL